MFPKKKKIQRRQIKKKNAISNKIIVSILAFIIIGFIISGIDRLFFNDGLNMESPDLSKLLTKTKYEKKTGHKIEIEIWNGCGIPKLADMYSYFLRSEGIDVLDSKNADNFNYKESKILHHRGELERALALADIMVIDEKNIMEDKNDNLFLDLTLIIGEDYSELKSYRNAMMHQQPF